jgi:tripartite-type tricarboxylate transporter receptor subunit TctC
MTCRTRFGAARDPALRCVACGPLLLALSHGAAHAQDAPTRPHRIVTIEAGGGNDRVARLVALGWGNTLGQRIIVENRGGASGVIAAETVVKATPDGHTLLSLSGSLWLLPFMQAVPYDPVKDLVPVTQTVTSPNLLVINPALPVRNVRELIALARARPGELNYASAGTGSGGHLGMELFKNMARVNIVRVAYKGGAPAMTDLISGEVQLSITSTGTAGGHVQSGRLRALAVTSARPTPLAPGLPTIASQGLPGYEMASTYGLFVPARTPPAVVERLHREIARGLRTAEIRERFFRGGSEVVAGTPAEFAAVIAAEQTKLGKLIRDTAIRTQ